MTQRENINFLRIIFTYIIVLYHILTVNFNIWSAGWLGVEFFFILSGTFFVLTYSPDKKINDFISNKIIRFLPLNIFGALLGLFFSSSLCVEKFFADVFLYSAIFPNITGYNGPAWYISILFWVLLLFFLILNAFEEKKCDLIIFVITFISSICVIKYRDIFFGPFSPHLLRGLSCIGIGYFLGKFYKTFKGKVMYSSILEIFLLPYCILSPFVLGLFQDRIISCICFSILIFLFLQNNGVISIYLQKIKWHKISKYCLSIFLTHGAITSFIVPKLTYLGVLKTTLLSIVIITILAIISHHIIEIPVLNIKKRKENNR